MWWWWYISHHKSEFQDLDFICLFKRWTKFIDRMMSVSHIELDCHLETCLVWVVAHTIKDR